MRYVEKSERPLRGALIEESRSCYQGTEPAWRAIPTKQVRVEDTVLVGRLKVGFLDEA